MSKAQLSSTSSLAFVGLGALGLPMAANLLAAGYELKVHSRSRAAELNWALKGSRSCSSPAEAAADSQALMICVSDDEAVEAVLFGSQGAASMLSSGAVVVDFSTIAPATSITLAQRLAQQGVTYLDAPVTGGTEGARAGTLTVLVGGSAQVLARVQPLLEVIGETIHHFGPVGRGQQVKALNQVLVAGSYAALAEAIALGQQLGLPMQEVIKALQDGAAGSWALKHRSTAMLEDHYPLGFKLALHHKDLGIALETAERVGLQLPITSQVKSMEEHLIEHGHSEEDVSVLRRWFDQQQAESQQF
ncbi:NAD(P)-dependent oxidoreductase [Prochlorococcus marinus]|uniref:NAD(P)-dependent oxidoreductase n=1 Tax=Prochlorococcus TaxID=1218 RepID=UPI0007B33516|nr:NAD(P)-dependent oxidoreductase [Prochlorococcus marinus]KZR74561.1 2-(hydroxymethyl)glutarate dehydrogenase [Prochlorococcus marinus str. MIT 1323]